MIRSLVPLLAAMSFALLPVSFPPHAESDDSAATASLDLRSGPSAPRPPSLCSRTTTCVVDGLAVVFLAAFLPISAISFHRFRLPRKEQEYTKVVRVLDLGEEAAALSIPALKNEYSGSDYWFPVGFSTLVTALGAFAVIFGNRFWDPTVPSLPVFFQPLCGATQPAEQCHAYGMAIIALALLGGYIWSVQHVLRRLITVDLPPGTYFGVGLRLIFVSFLALMVAFVLPKASMPPIAFLIGFFPQEALHYLKSRFDLFNSSSEKQADPLPLDMVEGISFYHKIRLGEIGIDNTQNLACAGLAELLVRTPFRPKLLIDWIAQAKLCIAFRPATSALRDAGVRTIIDLKNLGDKGYLQDIAKRSNVDEIWIRSVYELAKNDPAVDRLDGASKLLSEA